MAVTWEGPSTGGGEVWVVVVAAARRPARVLAQARRAAERGGARGWGAGAATEAGWVGRGGGALPGWPPQVLSQTLPQAQRVPSCFCARVWPTPAAMVLAGEEVPHAGRLETVKAVWAERPSALVTVVVS